MKWISIVACLFCLEFHCNGNIILGENTEDQILYSNTIEFYEDVTNNATIEELELHPEKYLFKSGESKERFSYHIHSNYWIRFKITNKNINSRNWIFEILDSRFDEVTFYAPDLTQPSHYTTSRAGLKVLDKRKYEHKNFIFDIPIQLSQTESNYFYLKIHPGTIGSFLFKIRSNNNFNSYAVKEYLFLGMYYGILLIIALYNFFLYFSTKDKVYLYYFFYVVAWACDSSTMDGLGFQFIWSQRFLSAIGGSYMFKIVMLVIYLVYSHSFLNVARYVPALNKSIYVMFLLLVVCAFFPYSKNHFSFDFVIFTYTLIIASLVYSKGYKPARYLMFGNVFILFGLVLKIINSTEWFNFMIQDSRVLTIGVVYIRHLTMILDIVILSLALGYRIRFLKQQTEQAQLLIDFQLGQNRILIDKLIAEKKHAYSVEEKVEQLTIKAEELRELNVELDSDNLKLKKNVIEEKEASLSLKPLSFGEFSLVYVDEDEAYLFLEAVKWGSGYACKKCGHKKFGKGTAPFARRCLECRYNESIKVNTVFNNCKFDMRKALYLTFLINRYGENISVIDIAKELDIRYATCRIFLQKLLVTASRKEFSKLKDEDRLTYLILNS